MKFTVTMTNGDKFNLSYESKASFTGQQLKIEIVEFVFNTNGKGNINLSGDIAINSAYVSSIEFEKIQDSLPKEANDAD